MFAYRALCFARNNKTALLGFDQDAFDMYSRAIERSIKGLLSEYETARNTTLSLFKSFDQKTLALIGVPSNSSLSVRAVAFIILGHENPYLEIIKERYL